MPTGRAKVSTTRSTFRKKFPSPTSSEAVTHLARGQKLDRIVALDEFDMETAATLREHLRIPGMGLTTMRYFRDKLAMRMRALDRHVRVPDFVPVVNHDDIRYYLEHVPGPWVLKPRQEASAIGIKKIHAAEELWPLLEQLGDKQSSYLLEKFVPGDVYHVDSVVSENEVVFANVSKYGKPPMNVAQGGGIFTTFTVPRGSEDDSRSARHQSRPDCSAGTGARRLARRIHPAPTPTVISTFSNVPRASAEPTSTRWSKPRPESICGASGRASKSPAAMAATGSRRCAKNMPE